MGICSYCRSWFSPPDPDKDSEYQQELAWDKGYDVSTLPGEHAAFALDYARAKYDQREASYAKLDEKAEGLLRTSATLASLLVGAVVAFKLSPFWWTLPSFAFFLSGMVFSLIARRPIPRAAATTARYVLDGLPGLEGPRAYAWLAAGFHCSTERLRVTCQWKATMVNRVTCLVCLGVGFLTVLPFLRP